jgi:hypothetical protein
MDTAESKSRYLTGYEFLFEILEENPGCVNVLVLLLTRSCLLVWNADCPPVVRQDVSVPAIMQGSLLVHYSI